MDAASSTHRKARRSETRRHSSHATMPGDEVTSVVRNGNRRGNEGGIKAACQMTASFVGDTL